MKTPNIGNIAASEPITKTAKFNLSHDNNTTYDWGSVQPLLSKLMLPDSSMNVKTEQLTRLAPMVVPTFGRVKLKNIAHFVACQEIYPNWDAMISQTKVTRPNMNSNGAVTSVTYVPKKVPYINNNILAAYCLTGAKVNIYVSGTVGTDTENSWKCPYNGGTFLLPTWSAGTTAARAYINSILRITNSDAPTTSTISALNYTGYTMNVAKLCRKKDGTRMFTQTTSMTLPTISTMTCQPMANANGSGYTHSASNEINKYTLSTVNEAITFDGADIIWEYAGSNPSVGISSSDRAAGSLTPIDGLGNSDFDGCKIRLVFKLSSYGKRLRKILIGLGYDINLSNDDEVSILPLIAFYKAWWDSYAPERTKNFYETNAWKIINTTLASANGANLLYWLNDTNGTGIRTYFQAFMGDLGTCFATEKIDAISAATDSYYGQVGTTTDTLTGTTDIQKSILTQIEKVLEEPKTANIINADGSYNTKPEEANLNTNTNSILNSIAQHFTRNSDIVLTQPQIDALKKGYTMMNKCSIAGMATEEILRALGFGDYVEECKGRFINIGEENIKISDVVATAATDDAKLGQYGGRGLGYGEFQFSHKTNRHGYIIVLSSIIPESGYVNAPAHENEAISFESMYNGQLDGIAYEAIQKKNLAGSPLINDATYADTFGFLPTYSQWKFMTNKANGDFSLNSMKNSMMPFTIDKYIPVTDSNTYKIVDDSAHAGTKIILCSPPFKYSDMPNAGEEYRYINKYPWNGNYNRIFAADGDGYEWSVFSPNNDAFLYNSFEFDNFMVHNVFEITYWAKMKPIEESYGTYDEEHGAPKTTIQHA